MVHLLQYGHHERKCNKTGSEDLCRHCGEVTCIHDSANCKNSIKSANCGFTDMSCMETGERKRYRQVERKSLVSRITI